MTIAEEGDQIIKESHQASPIIHSWGCWWTFIMIIGHSGFLQMGWNPQGRAIARISTQVKQQMNHERFTASMLTFFSLFFLAAKSNRLNRAVHDAINRIHHHLPLCFHGCSWLDPEFQPPNTHKSFLWTFLVSVDQPEDIVTFFSIHKYTSFLFTLVTIGQFMNCWFGIKIANLKVHQGSSRKVDVQWAY